MNIALAIAQATLEALPQIATLVAGYLTLAGAAHLWSKS